MKLVTPHLNLDHGFVTINNPDGDDIDCGRISSTGRRSTCLWPFGNGPEPDWFETEVDHLMEQVQIVRNRLNTEARDYESQVNADYLRGKGAK